MHTTSKKKFNIWKNSAREAGVDSKFQKEKMLSSNLSFLNYFQKKNWFWLTIIVFFTFLIFFLFLIFFWHFWIFWNFEIFGILEFFEILKFFKIFNISENIVFQQRFGIVCSTQINFIKQLEWNNTLIFTLKNLFHFIF